jgi:hypothetical protein
MHCPRKLRCVDPLAIGVLFGAFGVVGCGGPQATVSGCITCEGKPVTGVVLFSSKGDSAGGVHQSVSAPLSPTGNYTLQLNGVGKYMVVVTPSDVVLRPKAGSFDYPCDRTPKEFDIAAGNNDVTIELPKRSR